MSPSPGKPTHVRRRRLQVAIAEDDDEQREALERALEAEGFDVLSFEDGFELVDYFADAGSAKRWPSAVVTDVDMPGRTGLDAIEQARRNGAQVPVFVITGLSSAEVRARAASLGNTLVFQKPIDVDQLAEAIRGLASP